ncbi:MAG TPA: DegT/DnrJ/EryC1/StrS family aminotransferase [Nitriliruptorales bacterium]|nr:DegT/DnrJ/EryC1/StrS family aminotransferase [Nitriliruptorales bacterium]
MSAAPAVLGGDPAFPRGLPLVRPDLGDTSRLSARLEAILASGILTDGPTVRALEEAVADYLGVGHVVAVASGTSGLMLVMQACGLDGRVVMPSFTFAATAHAAHWAGARVTFADIEPASLTLDPEDVRERVDGAAAVVGVHLYGTPCAVEALQEVADHAGIPVIYDAAHALGSRRAGCPVGRFGVAEVFSLSPTKVTVAGEGGLITTDDDALAETCRLGRGYGNPGDYDCLFPGLNARMSELHAAVALHAFERLDERVARRNALAARLRRRVHGLRGVGFPEVAAGDTSTVKDLTVLVDADGFGLSAQHLAAALAAEGIDTRRYYHPPVHRQKAYAHLGPPHHLPVTDRVAERALTLPLWSHLPARDVDRVADAIARIHAQAAAVRQVLP